MILLDLLRGVSSARGLRAILSGTSRAQFFVGPEVQPDKYALVRQVGSGGEATLWEATVTVAGQPETVAVKALRPEHQDDFERFSARWAEQAELLRFVRHPSVVGVREHFEGGGPHLLDDYVDSSRRRALYLVMNWVGGRSFDEWVAMNDGREGTLAGLRLLEQVADALDELHSGRVAPSGRPVIHGDLSPRNVMITDDGRAILVDFGLARLAAHQTRMAFGTPGYAAPEVWQQGQYSPQSDRYAFAALGYFALRGQAPPTDVDELRADLFGHPLLDRAPASQQAAIMRGFSADSDQRPSARDWLAALRGGTTMSSRHFDSAGPVVSQATKIDTHPAARPARRPVVSTWGAWAASFVALILLSALLLAQGDDGSSPARVPESGVTTTRPTAEPSTPTTQSGSVAVRRRSDTPVTLTRSYAADLDSMAPNWNVGRSNSFESQDLIYDETVQGDDDGYINGTEAAPVSEPVDFATCAAATGYATRQRISAGDRFCLRTSDKRFAYLTIRGAGQGEAVFDIVVWDPPYSSG